jgi:hypothetical protein
MADINGEEDSSLWCEWVSEWMSEGERVEWGFLVGRISSSILSPRVFTSNNADNDLLAIHKQPEILTPVLINWVSSTFSLSNVRFGLKILMMIYWRNWKWEMGPQMYFFLWAGLAQTAEKSSPLVLTLNKNLPSCPCLLCVMVFTRGWWFTGGIEIWPMILYEASKRVRFYTTVLNNPEENR